MEKKTFETSYFTRWSEAVPEQPKGDFPHKSRMWLQPQSQESGSTEKTGLGPGERAFVKN